MTCIIVGGGVAGFSAAATCRALWPDRPVTLIDAEKEVGYYRALLPQFMVGALPEEKLFFKRDTDPGLTIRTSVRARKLDRKSGRLLIDTGEELPFDRLILAHGGEAYLPEGLTGPPAKGIFPLRDLSTAREIKAWLPDHGKKVIVFGGSLVGVKTAVYLRQAGYDVSLVVRRGHILLRALSTESATLIETHLRGLGIHIVVNAPLEDLRIIEGKVAAIKAGGQWLEAGTLLVAAGVLPDTAFLEGTGLLTEGELLVSPSLQSADPRIFAAGDVAVIAASGGDKISPNTWPQAVSQGKWAAENLYRTTPLPHRDLTRINAMELHGLAMVILGPPVEGTEVLSFASPEAMIRRELFLLGGKPVGGALIGDISAAGTLHALMNTGRPLTPRQTTFLRPGRRNVLPLPEPISATMAAKL